MNSTKNPDGPPTGKTKPVVRRPTIADLQSQVEERDAEIRSLRENLRAEGDKAARLERNARQEEGKYRHAEGLLRDGKQAIVLVLSVKYGVGVEPAGEWFRGKTVEDVEITEDIRFLRHLHQTLDSKPPF